MIKKQRLSLHSETKRGMAKAIANKYLLRRKIPR